MRYQRWAAWFLAGAIACLAMGRPANAAEAGGERIKLSVLYVGETQSERAKDFVLFLEKHFTKVGQGDLSKFGEKDVQGYDAVIMDYGPVVVKDNRIETPPMPFSMTYSRPTLMLGATGGLMSSRLKLKTGYS
jgi:hypothetical protein